MTTRDKLKLEESCAKIGYSHFMIKLTCEEEWEKRQALASWRLEIYDYIVSLNSSKIQYILDYFKKYNQVIYLEILTMLSDKKINCLNSRNDFLFRIINYIKKFKKGTKSEKVCSNSSVHIGGNCNVS